MIGRVPRYAAASIAHDYEVDADGELCCQWDPVIPFAGARLEQRFVINLDASARLLWGDAIMAGRGAKTLAALVAISNGKPAP